MGITSLGETYQIIPLLLLFTIIVLTIIIILEHCRI